MGTAGPQTAPPCLAGGGKAETRATVVYGETTKKKVAALAVARGEDAAAVRSTFLTTTTEVERVKEATGVAGAAGGRGKAETLRCRSPSSSPGSHHHLRRCRCRVISQVEGATGTKFKLNPLQRSIATARPGRGTLGAY